MGQRPPDHRQTCLGQGHNRLFTPGGDQTYPSGKDIPASWATALRSTTGDTGG